MNLKKWQSSKRNQVCFLALSQTRVDTFGQSSPSTRCVRVSGPSRMVLDCLGIRHADRGNYRLMKDCGSHLVRNRLSHVYGTVTNTSRGALLRRDVQRFLPCVRLTCTTGTS